MQFKSLVLVHGAGSGPQIFNSWRYCFGPIDLRAVDLLADIDADSASMADYAGAVEKAAHEAPRPRACCGWSMGGLVAMMAHESFDALILIEPSPPAELQGYKPHVSIPRGTFEPEDVYGRFPTGIQSRPESNLARGERKKGISIPSLNCPSLVVFGDEFPEVRGQAISRFYGSQALGFPRFTHWDLVLRCEVRDAILNWLLNTI